MAINKNYIISNDSDKDRKYLDLEGLQKVLQNIDTKLLPESKGASATVEPAFKKVGRTSRGYIDLGADVVKEDITKTGVLSAANSTATVYLAGTTVQGGTPTTLNSNANVYMINGVLYSEGKQVALKDDLSKAVVFKGTLGEDGTIKTLPTAEKSTEGDMYIVITPGWFNESTGTYQMTEPSPKTGWVEVKKGDTFICGNIKSAYKWVLIPSGDEPSGTVTNVATGDGLTGGPITTSGTIDHKKYTSQAAAAMKVGIDEYGHVIAGSALSVKASEGSHTHGFSGTVTVPTVSSTTKKLSIDPTTVLVITGVTDTKNKLEQISIAPATVSKATAATPVVYGVADVGSKISITPAKDNGNASYATFNKTITYGTANVGTATRYGTANVGTAVVYGTADVGDQISITPAVAGGTASYVTSSTYVVYGNANIGTEKTAVSSVGFADDKQAYEAKYDDTELALELTPITLSAQTFKFNPANQSSATFPVYTIKDVEVAKTGTAKTFNPAVAAPDTQTLTPAAEAPENQTLTPAQGSSEQFNYYTFTNVAVAKADTAVEFTPAKAADTSRTITPYSFADVNVAATSVTLKVATGKVGTGAEYTGDEIVTSTSTTTNSDVITKASKIKAAVTGDVSMVDNVSVGTETATVTGSVTGDGTHNHTIE